MEMNEIKAVLPNCPRCGRHCPIDQTSCPRGQELVEKLLSGEMTLEEATAPRDHGERGEHGDHSHGEHGDHPHGHHGEHGDHPHGHHHSGHDHPHGEHPHDHEPEEQKA